MKQLCFNGYYTQRFARYKEFSNEQTEVVLDDFLKEFCNVWLEEEFTVQSGAERYQRGNGREDIRNGHYTRRIITTRGVIDLRVPRGQRYPLALQPLRISCAVIVPIILYHHEKYDGTGYPKGLKGKGIPLAARILAIVGAFEAMITAKPYRRALSIRSAVKEVRKNTGTQFDPRVAEVFCEAIQRKDVMKLLEKELGIHEK